MKIEKWGDWNDIFYSRYPSKTVYTKEQEKCVIDEIRKKGYKFSGDYHQNGDYGVPYFDNGVPFMVSKREWGSIMAAAWPEDIQNWIHRNKNRQDGKMTFIAFSWDTSELDNIYVYPTEGGKE